MSDLVSMLRRVKDGDVSYDHLWFVCPGCASRNQGDTGLHALPVYRTGQPKANTTRPQWEWNGDLLLPTLNPSILTRSDYAGVLFVCHSWLRNGVFEFLGDCTHQFANQRVSIGPLPDWFIKEG
jgi:hypothetical protein